MYKMGMILILGLISSCGFTTTKQNDYSEIVSTLVGIQNEKYVVKGSYDALLAYRGWGALYDKYMTAVRNQGQIEDIKIYLLLGFVAQIKAQVATSEAFSSDLYDIFVTHTDVTLEALKQNPYLVTPTCYYIGNYFGFESNNSEKKILFIETYTDQIKKSLRTGGYEQCMAQITMPKRLLY